MSANEEPNNMPVAAAVEVAHAPVVAGAAPPVAAAVPASALPVAAAAAVPAAVPVAGRAPIPVAATAPKLVIPTAAPIAAAPVAQGMGTGGLFGTIARLQSRMEHVASRHAPGLVSAIKEQVAVAHMREEREQVARAKLAELAEKESAAAAAASEQPAVVIADGETPPSSSSSAKAKKQPSTAIVGGNVAHIPGLGAIALAAPTAAPESSEKQAKAAQVWSNLDSPPDEAGLALQRSASGAGADPAAAELRRRKGTASAAEMGSKAAPAPESASKSSAAPPTPSSAASSSSSSAAAAPLPVAAPAAAATPSTKMDLPLRLCLVILKKSSVEMRDRYGEYLKTKAARREGDEPLSFAQFMFFSTIRTLPDFLFRKTELAYCMMREEGDTLVFEENFVRYAPILAPLASKLDARSLYLALQGASIAAGAALTPEQVAIDEIEMEAEAVMAQNPNGTAAGGVGAGAAGADAELSLDQVAASSAAGSSSTSRAPKLKAGGVGYVQFKSYVEALKKFVKRDSAENGWPEAFASFPELAAAGPQEQLLVVRTGVTDTTTFPPHIGRMGITTNFLLYESSFFKRKRAIRWSSIVRIERNDEGFWRKKLPTAVMNTISSEKESSHKARGINIFIQEDEAPSSSLDSSSSLASGGGGGGGGPRKPEECLSWDQPGWGAETAVERTRTFEYMKIMLALQRLVVSLPDKVVASALVQETCMSMLRMRALEGVGPGVNPLLLNPFSDKNISATRQATAAVASTLSSSSATNKALAAVDTTSFSAGAAAAAGPDGGASPPISASHSLVASIAASISRAEGIRKSKSSWLFAVLPGLQDRAKENLEEDIDPELCAGSNYKTAEELALLARAVEQPFSLKNFAYNVKLFRHEIDPLLLFFALIRRVRDWENPLLTLATVLLLLNMAYRDLLMYLPALMVLLNIALLATLRYYPHAVEVALGGAAIERANAEALAKANSSGGSGGPIVEEMLDGTESKEEREALLANPNSSSSSSSSSSANMSASERRRLEKEELENGGLLAKLKNYRDVAVRTKDYLHSVQNSIGEQNVKMMKIEGLYKWRSPAVTQKFFLQLCVVFLVLVFIPFRFIFPVIVLDFFTTKWQRQSGFERLMQEVALPATMPDVD